MSPATAMDNIADGHRIDSEFQGYAAQSSALIPEGTYLFNLGFSQPGRFLSGYTHHDAFSLGKKAHLRHDPIPNTLDQLLQGAT